nr:immunoglobulin light chain junction region [Macaca mulatta]
DYYCQVWDDSSNYSF